MSVVAKSKIIERPILFSGPMVRAILRTKNPKTQTRRLVRPQPVGREKPKCRFNVGDRLWVRERWGIRSCGSRASLAKEAWPDCWPIDRLFYAADEPGEAFGLRNSIFMPRWASRLDLIVTDIRCERLQQISPKDLKAEGFSFRGQTIADFKALWEKLNGEKFPWDSNPWVWVISFRKAKAKV